MTRFHPADAITTSLAVLAIAAVPTLAAPPGPLPFGVYDPDGQFINDAEVTIEHVFLPWEDVNLASLLEADVYALERKRALLITIEPWTWTRDERNTADFLWNGIQQGYYDANMRAVCAVIGTLQSPVSVRWGHEMETDDGQFIWSAWKPENYIVAFRRMTEICRAEAPKINVIWSPIGLENASDYYPGDDYVDLVGLSIFGYEAWEKAILGGPQDYAEVLTQRYDEVKQYNKPVVVAEVGYTGSQAYVDGWEAKVREARPDLPLLVGAVYFNQKEVYPWPNDFGYPDWRINSRVTP
ncbi:MAG: beta-mannosidase [Fuscovulum sp.]|jgi:endoglucanase|nr:beta-mannosidase [Fuscovulum sp.]